jgi:hypothetical protein
MVLVLMLRANSGFPNFARAPNIPPRRFRRLFAAAQSTAASKLANPLKSFGFLVLRQTVG